MRDFAGRLGLSWRFSPGMSKMIVSTSSVLPSGSTGADKEPNQVKRLTSGLI